MNKRGILLLMVVIVVGIATTCVVAPKANACEDCWPGPYYTVMHYKPSNWVTVGGYQPGDAVFRGGVSGPWYVVPGAEHNSQAPFPECCPDGAYFVTEAGGLFLP